MSEVRTTLTLDSDVAAMVRRAVQQTGRPLKQVVNETLRAGFAGPRSAVEHSTPTFAMGEPTVSLVKALQLADALEDEELVRRLAVRR